MPRPLRLLLAALLVATPLTFAAGAPPATAASGPEITTESLPEARVGSHYSFNLDATGGTGDFRFRVSVGRLPAGLILYPHGLISGEPREAGPQVLLIAATDTAGATAVRYLTLEVAKGPATRVSWLDIWPAQPRIGQAAMVGVDHSPRPVEFYLVDPTGTRTELCSHQTSCTTPTLTIPGRYTFGAALPETADWVAGEGVTRTVEVLRQRELIQARLDGPVGGSTHIVGPGASLGATLINVPEDATGTFSFRADAQVLASVDLPLTTDLITLDLSGLGAGEHLIRGWYSGDARYEPYGSLPGSVTMVDRLVWQTPRELPAATYSEPYVMTLQASDPTATVSLSPGTVLPAGLSLTGRGRIAGFPEQVGRFTFELVARSGTQEVSREFTLTVTERVVDYDVTLSTAVVPEGAGATTITVTPPGGSEFTWYGIIVPADHLEHPEDPVEHVCVMPHPVTSCTVDVSDLPAGRYLVSAAPTGLTSGWAYPDVPTFVDLRLTPSLELVGDDLTLGAGQAGSIGLAAPLPADATGTVTVTVTPVGSGKRVPAPGEVLCSFDVTRADSCELPADLTPGRYPLTVTYDGNYGLITTTAALTISVVPTLTTPPPVEPIDPAVVQPVEEVDPPPASGAARSAPGHAPTAHATGEPDATGVRSTAEDSGRDELGRTGSAPLPMAALAVALCLAGATVLHRTRQV